MHKASLTMTAAVLAILNGPAQAQPVQVAPGTVVYFESTYFGFFSKTGQFNGVSGTIDFKEPKIGDEQIDVTIDTASLQTDDEEWQIKLCEPDFFDCAKYPQMHFRSTSVEELKSGGIRINGILTAKGFSNPFSLEARFDQMRDAHGRTVAYRNFRGTGTLDRSDYGMTAMYPIISDEVEIEIVSATPIAAHD